MAEPDRLILAHSIEALFLRALEDRLTPELLSQLRQIGLDLERLLPAYPHLVWSRALEVTARTVYPELSEGDAHRKLGEHTVTGWSQTLIGRAMITLCKLAGPRRTLLRFNSMARSSNNFARMSVRDIGDGIFEVVCEPYRDSPQYVEGVLLAVIDVSGGRQPRVWCVEHDPAIERVVLHAKWE